MLGFAWTKKSPLNDTPCCCPKATQGDPKVRIVEVLAPKETPKWNQKSTLVATGRQSENRAPVAARILNAMEQIPKLMKKRFWFGVPARALLFRILKPARIKKDASRPQNEPQSDPRMTPDITKNRYFWPAWGTWRAKVGLPWPKRRPWHQKVTKFRLKSPEDT